MKDKVKRSKIYLVVYAPETDTKFKIVPIEFGSLSWKHPLVRKAGAIFADEEYAKQFYNFVVTNAKKQDDERKQAVMEELKQKQERESKKRILDK